MLILCAWGNFAILHAQIYTTSSAIYKPFSGGSTYGSALPAASDFRSTSLHVVSKQSSTAVHANYIPVEIKLANGAIRTAAAAIGGGQLASEPASDSSGFIPSGPQYAPGQGGIAPPDTPLGDTWQVLLLMAIAYAIYIRRKQKANAI